MSFQYRLVFVLLFFQHAAGAFDYRIHLREKTFENTNYSFTLVKVIDGRLNPQKPVGFVPSSTSPKPHSVGNDSLALEMNDFFKNKPALFDTTVKIIVVVNQLNMRFFFNTEQRGNNEDLEITLSLDYYRISGNGCRLVYQQFYKDTELVAFSGPTKSIDLTFSMGLKFALRNFNKELRGGRLIASSAITDTAALSNLYAQKAEQALNHKEVKDGIYFSCRSLYLNKPDLVKDLQADTLPGGKFLHLQTRLPEAGAYCVVKNQHVFIYVAPEQYREASFSKDNKLYFADVSYYKSEYAGQEPVNFAIALLWALLSPQSGLLSTHHNRQVEVTDILLDLETGLLSFGKVENRL